MFRTAFNSLRVGLLKIALRVLGFPALRHIWVEDLGEPWATEGVHYSIPLDKLPAVVNLERD